MPGSGEALRAVTALFMRLPSSERDLTELESHVADLTEKKITLPALQAVLVEHSDEGERAATALLDVCFALRNRHLASTFATTLFQCLSLTHVERVFVHFKRRYERVRGAVVGGDPNLAVTRMVNTLLQSLRCASVPRHELAGDALCFLARVVPCADRDSDPGWSLLLIAD
ncbi:MAG: hypothetical protein MHM6MM_009118 [Cercozoa sp. M6MM]